MKTEQRIQEIAEELRELIHRDNDSPRFIEENLSDLIPTQSLTISTLQSNLEEAIEENEKLKDQVSDLEDDVERLEKQIEDLEEEISGLNRIP